MAYLAKHNVLFVHIPKNAGKSVEVALKLTGTKSIADVGRRSNLNRLMAWSLRKTANSESKKRLLGSLDVTLCSQHLTLQEIMLLGLLPPQSRDGLRTFAVARNPWARAVSSFKHFSPHVELTPADFENFCERWYDEPSADHNVLAHKRSQVDFVLDVRGKNGVDRVIRFENLADDFTALCRDWQLDADELPHIGKQGSGVDYRALYTDRSRKIIDDRFAEDAEFFGYTF